MFIFSCLLGVLCKCMHAGSINLDNIYTHTNTYYRGRCCPIKRWTTCIYHSQIHAVTCNHTAIILCVYIGRYDIFVCISMSFRPCDPVQLKLFAKSFLQFSGPLIFSWLLTSIILINKALIGKRRKVNTLFLIFSNNLHHFPFLLSYLRL